MPHPFVLSASQTRALNAGDQRFTLYAALHDPVLFTVQSQDLTTDNGQVQPAPTVDLLAQRRAPFAPLPVMGSNRIGFVGEPLYFCGLRSTQRHNLLAWNHQWSASGPATIQTYATAQAFGTAVTFGVTPSVGNQQCRITWTAPGNYTVLLSVEDRYGNTGIGIRQVRIYPARSATMGGIVSVDTIAGSVAGTSYSTNITVTAAFPGLQNPDALAVGQYLPVTIMAELVTGSSATTAATLPAAPYGAFVPGQCYDDPRIVFAGYVRAASLAQDDGKSLLTLSCQTPDLVLAESHVFNIGYYNALWHGTDSQGRWNSQTAINSQSDHLVADLTVPDLYRSLLFDHSPFAQFHDVYAWTDWLPDPASAPASGAYTSFAVTTATWSGLSVNEGTILAAVQQLAQNDSGTAWCERDGSFRIGPPPALRNAAAWATVRQPTLTAAVTPAVGDALAVWPADYFDATRAQAETLVTGAYTAFPPNGTAAGTPPRAAWPIQWIDPWLVYNWRNECYPTLVPAASTGGTPYAVLPNRPAVSWAPGLPFPFGPQRYPVGSADGGPADRDPTAAQIVPILLHLADAPIGNGQLANATVIPLSLQIDETYASRSAFVKLIGARVLTNNLWAAFYPTDAFDSNGFPLYQLTAGSFDLSDGLALPDFGQTAAVNLAWTSFWQLARLLHAQKNARYLLTATLGLTNAPQLLDLVWVTRQASAAGPLFTRALYCVTGLSLAPDTSAGSWTTTLTLEAVTSADPAFATPVIPPYAAPAAS